MYETIRLPDDPAEATRFLLNLSRENPVLLFKMSPTCPSSAMAEGEILDWLDGREGKRKVSFAELDVVAARTLARGISGELEILHESPQVILLDGGAVLWHGSHGQLRLEKFREIVDGEK